MTGIISGNIITIRQGDSFTLNFQISDGCAALDLTNARLIMQVRDAHKQLVWTLFGTAVDVKNGKMAILITPAQTEITVGDYVTDIQLETDDGSVHTIFPANVNQIGVLRITQQVTQSA